MSDPLFSYKRFGFSFQLFDNRIETATRQFLGTTKADTLLLRQVSSVQTKPGKLILFCAARSTLQAAMTLTRSSGPANALSVPSAQSACTFRKRSSSASSSVMNRRVSRRASSSST